MKSSRPLTRNSCGSHLIFRTLSSASAAGLLARNATNNLLASMPERFAYGLRTITSRNSGTVRTITLGRKPKLRSMPFSMRAGCGEIALVRAGDNVAALDVGLRVAKSQRFVHGAELIHFYFVVAAHVDAAQHGKNHAHIAAQYSARFHCELRAAAKMQHRWRTIKMSAERQSHPDDRIRRVFALLGTTLFLVVAPGCVAGLVPWWISRWRFRAPFPGYAPLRVIGAILIAAGTFVVLDSFARFALQGLGTPAPVFPT